MNIILPLYDLRYYQRVLALCKLYGNRCLVICNVNSGPGASIDDNWKDKIKELRKTGAKLVGYIDAMRWPGDGTIHVDKERPSTDSELMSERNKWLSWYGIICSFYDDVTKLTGVPSTCSKGDVLNYGTEPFKTPPAGTIAVVFETQRFLARKPGMHYAYPSAAFSLGEVKYQNVIKLAKSQGINYLFCTDRKDKKSDGSDDWTTYNDLPAWFEAFCKTV